MNRGKLTAEADVAAKGLRARIRAEPLGAIAFLFSVGCVVEKVLEAVPAGAWAALGALLARI